MRDRVRKLRRRARKSLNLRSVSREDTPDTPGAVEGSWTRERTGLEPLCPAAPLAIHRFPPRPTLFPGHEADAADFASPLPEVPIIGRALRGVHVILTSGNLRPVSPAFARQPSAVIPGQPGVAAPKHPSLSTDRTGCRRQSRDGTLPTLARSDQHLHIPLPGSADCLPAICRCRPATFPEGKILWPAMAPPTLSRATMISLGLFRRNVQTVEYFDFLCISEFRVHKLSTTLSTKSAAHFCGPNRR